MKAYEKHHKLKYETKDSPEHIFAQIKAKSAAYFASHKTNRYGNLRLLLKLVSMALIVGIAYVGILHSHNFGFLLFFYIVFGLMFLIIGINFGHDAAHHCVTGHRKFDNLLFQLIFGLQGLSGYVWQIRHNFSHHIFPNVYENDTDLEMSGLILLSPHQKKLAIHKYQHIYAPFVYLTFSLAWIFFVDISMFVRKKHANLKLGKIPAIEVVKLILIKTTYLFTFIYIPYLITGLPLLQILSAYLLMNFSVSIFLAFTFFISHHVLEADYAEPDHSKAAVSGSWVHHQIVSTIDFCPESPVGNYIFGGFNLHIAHHIFPEVSHIHYPELTRIIRETLEENNLDWYKSFGFFDGVISHLTLLKRNGSGQFEHENYLTPIL